MTAASALDAALDMELIVDISQVNDGTGLCRVNLLPKHKGLILLAVKAAVEEERERCVTIINTADVFSASEYIGEIVVSAGEITARILKAPR